MSDKKKFSFKEAIKGIRDLVSGFSDTPAAGDPNATDNLKEYTTDAGASIKIDKLEVGGKVVDADGTTPIAKGFKLADGTAVEVDDMGVITSVTVPSIDDNTGLTDEQIAMKELTAKFAAGTPEERIANLETMCLAMMQYCFGWKIDEATRKSLEEQAIAIYKTIAPPAQFTEQIEAQKAAFAAEATKYKTAFESVLAILEKFADEPDGDPADGKIDPKESKRERALRVIEEAKTKARQ